MKRITHIFILITIISSCKTKTDSKTNISTSEDNTYFEVYELTAVSRDRETVYFNVILGVNVNPDITSEDKDKEKEELIYKARAIASSHLRGIIGKYTKKENSELKKIHSEIQEEITKSLNELNTSLNKDRIEIIKLDATMRNK